jgi:hypothetical protein
MTNDNCLDGIQCPACGQEETFRIEITTMSTVSDDGAELEYGEMHWDETSYTECVDCLKHGPLSDFGAQSKVPPRAVPTPQALLAALSNLLGETDYDAAGTCIGCARERGGDEYQHCGGYLGEIAHDCPRGVG